MTPELPAWLTALDPAWLNAATLGLMFVEGAGVPGIPGILPMLAQAALISAGATSYPEAVLWGALGNFLGSLAGYALGAEILERLPARWRERMETPRVRRLTAHAGPLLIVLSRSVGSLRTPVTWTARALGVRPAPFTLWALVGAVLHVGLWQYLLWKSGEAALRYVRRAEADLTPVLLLAALGAALWWGVRRLRGRREDGTGSPPA
ncbi:DedA family protein [Deinococcus planocerae]|uniref:DedA family protein n=1 Tax=Deinococcus planocerae TaxID=1737569 RepID=UPI001FE5F5E2|nr:VTT domain-containing protein [Deinococcus planocerae]